MTPTDVRAPKRIALCSNTAWSIYNFRRGVIAALLAQGHAVHVIAPDDECTPHLRAMGCATHPIAIAAKGQNPLTDLRLLHALYRLYRHIAPDVVFHYTIKPNIYGAIAAHWAGVPSVSMTTGLGYVFINPGLAAAAARWLYRVAFRYPRENWFLNPDDRDTFVQRGLVSPAKARLLPGEGIDLAHFAAAPWPAPGSVAHATDASPPTFLMIARVLWDKGVGEYVEAARRLKTRDPAIRCRLLGAVGVDNPSAVPPAQVEQWRSEGLIDYLGTTDDVRPAIAAADCVVLPSYREGLSRTLLEAAAMARPLIASDVPGCRDVIDAGMTGLLCHPRDAGSLADAMARIAAMPIIERRRMGDAGRAKVAREFAESTVIAQYFRVLGSLP